MAGDSDPNWEQIARQELALNTQSLFAEEVMPHAHRVSHAIETGDDPEAEFWLLVARFHECIEHLKEDLQTIGVLDDRTPKMQLCNSAQLVHSSFLSLGTAIENDTVGDGYGYSDFEAVRDILTEADTLLDKLEAEYENTDDSGASDRTTEGDKEGEKGE